MNNLYEYINVDSSLEANIDIWLKLALDFAFVNLSRQSERILFVRVSIAKFKPD